MGLSADAYREQLKQLLPPGAAWSPDPGTTLHAVLDGKAQELARAEAFLRNVFEQALPSSTQELLSEWESVLGLPGVCSTEVRGSIAERRVDLISKLRATGGQSAEYYIEVSALYGVPVTIDEYRPFRAGASVAGDPLTNGDWVFTWTVRAASLADQPDAQRTHACLIEQLAPSHTITKFTYAKEPAFKALLLNNGTALITQQGTNGALLCAEKS